MAIESLEPRLPLTGVPEHIRDSIPWATGYVESGNELFFTMMSPDTGNPPWVIARTNGTFNGTGVVFQASQSSYDLIDVNGDLYFFGYSATGYGLWKRDNEAQFPTPTLVKDISPGTDANTLTQRMAGSLRGQLLLFANDGSGLELWRSDGTSSGTYRVEDINPGPASSINVGAGKPFVFDDTLYFSASDGANGFELWRSDGTEVGTYRVKDVNPGTGDSLPNFLTSLDGLLYFTADDGTHGRELWKTDGTEAGTTLVRDIRSGAASSNPIYGRALDQVLLVTADDGIHGYEIWRSDGTEAGTELVLDVALGTTSGFESDAFRDAAVANGIALFERDPTPGLPELWRSDGTVSGTYQLNSIPMGVTPQNPGYFDSTGEIIYFRGDALSRTERLWQSDGTREGTIEVPGQLPHSGHGVSSLKVWHNSVVYLYDIQRLYILRSGDPITAVDDVGIFGYTTSANKPIVINSTTGPTGTLGVGILANDRPGAEPGGPIFVGRDILDQTIRNDGSFVYTPTPGFTGKYTFGYRAYNVAGDSNQAIVEVTVNPPEVVELSSLATEYGGDGRSGFTVKGILPNDDFGRALAGIGDINNDGFDDFAIAAPLADAPVGGIDAGAVYVIFGHAGPYVPAIELATLDGSNGFIIRGTNASDRLGYSMDGAGDVNGDGTDDLIVGAFNPGNGVGQAASGKAYVVFGKSAPFNATFDLASLDGTNGFRIVGTNSSDGAGYSVSTAGDFNGDHFADLIVGAPYANANGTRSGQVYVIYGHGSPFSVEITPGTLSGSGGFVINGAVAGDETGISVASAQDFDVDGYGDLLIGAWLADPLGRDQAGRVYVIYGRAANVASPLNLATLSSANGIAFNGLAAGDHAGLSLDGAGNTTSFKSNDLIMSAPQHDGNGNFDAGEIYFMWGGSSRPSSSFVLGSRGYKLGGISSQDNLGRQVRGVGDVNHDGFNDVLMSSPFADSNGRIDAGELYLVYGTRHQGLTIGQAYTVDKLAGLTIHGVSAGDLAGSAIDGAGDINGDGYADLIIGAPTASPNGVSGAGQVYVIFGQPFFNVLPGDVNRDRRVDTLDMAILQLHYGRSGSVFWTQGDLDGDKDVDRDDVVVLARNFGQSAINPPAAAVAGSSPMASASRTMTARRRGVVPATNVAIATDAVLSAMVVRGHTARDATRARAIRSE